VTASGWGLVDSAFAVVFTDNHDNQRGHGNGYWTSADNNAIGGIVTNFYDGAVYNLSNVFMLAWPYGSPKVMSSYDWDRNVIEYINDDGNLVRKDTNDWVGPPSINGATKDVDCDNGWICEHRWGSIAGMVGFNNFTQDAWNIGHKWHNDANQIAFARVTDTSEGRGFVVINRENTHLSVTLPTGLAGDKYCDVTQGDYNFVPDVCTGSVVTVDDSGMASFSVPPMSASAIHVGAIVDGEPTPCSFSALSIRGTQNDWGTDAMTCVGDNLWRIDGVVFNGGDANGAARFKFDRFNNWKENYGDDDGDQIAEIDGDDIGVASTGTYTITFNDVTKAYTVEGGEPQETVKVTFSCDNGLTQPGNSVYVVGDQAALGNWTVASAAQKLEAANYPVWTDEQIISLPKNTTVKWKCVKANEGSLSISQWQGGSDNVITTGTSDTSVSASF